VIVLDFFEIFKKASRVDHYGCGKTRSE